MRLGYAKQEERAENGKSREVFHVRRDQQSWPISTRRQSCIDNEAKASASGGPKKEFSCISTLGDIDCRVTILSVRQSRKREPWLTHIRVADNAFQLPL